MPKKESTLMENAVGTAVKEFEKVKPPKKAKRAVPEISPEKAKAVDAIKDAISAEVKKVKKAANAVKTETPAKRDTDPNTPLGMANLVAQTLYDKKAHDILILDIEKKTVIADYFVLASARSTTAVSALAGHVDETLSKKHGIEPLRREGEREGRWAVLDYAGVIVHIFHEETRAFYQLERLWADEGETAFFKGE